MKIIFFGSDDFALMHLKKLRLSRHELLACVTKPDSPKGRHLKVSASSIKEWSLGCQIPVLQPKDLRDPVFFETLKRYAADVFVVIAYGKILSPEILSLPRLLAVNLHGSLLPRYRGAAPINWAILNGDEISGVTAIKMNPQMDAGEIIAQKEILIDPEENAAQFREKMAKISCEFLPVVLDAVEKGSYPLKPQDPALVTYAPKLTKDLGRIRWTESALNIANLVRGLQPWPGAFTFWKGKSLKILSAKGLSDPVVPALAAGRVLEISSSGFVVATGRGRLHVLHVLPEASKPMSALSFVAGYHVLPGVVLGE